MVIKLGDFTNFAKIGKKACETLFKILARLKQAQKLDMPLLTMPSVCCIQLTCLAIAYVSVCTHFVDSEGGFNDQVQKVKRDDA